MGSNSNRNETREEVVSRLSNQVRSTRDTSDFNFQISTGAEIRGRMGVEKGNQFINDMKKYR